MSAGIRQQPKRADLPPDADLCSYCTGKCCRYVSIPLKRPKSWKDFDALLWFMTRDNINIYSEAGSWYAMVMDDCRHLQSDNRCGHYEHRPQVCRDHKTADCEYEDDYDFEHLFENEDQLREFAEALLGPQQFAPTVVTIGAA